jgi:hypothetical protein
MSDKKTIRIKVEDDLSIAVVFKTKPTKEVKLILPDVVKERWQFGSQKEETAFAGFAAAIGGEFVNFGLSEEEVAKRFSILVRRTIKAGLLKRKDKDEEDK